MRGIADLVCEIGRSPYAAPRLTKADKEKLFARQVCQVAAGQKLVVVSSTVTVGCEPLGPGQEGDLDTAIIRNVLAQGLFAVDCKDLTPRACDGEVGVLGDETL